jgi:DNA invertase Pin-like site-specific DNA recombinase
MYRILITFSPILVIHEKPVFVPNIVFRQSLDSQLEQLRRAGCTSRNIYREKVTGARADRRELNRMLGKLAPGDVVAGVERDLIRTRTAEGRSRAKAQGKHMGRPPSLTPGTEERGQKTACAGRYAGRIGTATM